MRDAVIVEAVRTPIGRGKPITGWLNGFHATHLLALSLKGVLDRAGVDMDAVDQIVGGCVTQAGEQSCNVVRNSWLSMGKTYKVGATTVDTQCGSGQQANYMMSAFIKAGTLRRRHRLRRRGDESCRPRHQRHPRPRIFSAARLAVGHRAGSVHLRRAHRQGPRHHPRGRWTRSHWRRSRRRLRRAPPGTSSARPSCVQAPVLGEDGTPTGEFRTVDSDQGIRETSMEQLGALAAGDARRHSHRRQLVADLRRLGRGAVDVERQGARVSGSSRARDWWPTSSSVPIRTTCSTARSTPPTRCSRRRG